MKKRAAALALTLSLFWAVLSAFAAGEPGTPANPLVTLSYLRDKFTPMVTTEAAKRVNAALDEKNKTLNPEKAVISSPALINAVGAEVVKAIKSTDGKSQTITVTANQTLGLSQGTMVILLSGGAKLTSKPAVDLNAGVDISAGTVLTANHKYLFADSGGKLTFTAASTVLVDGLYTTSTLIYKPKYNDLAVALNEMNLIRGTGNGFALDRGVTRVEMLYMTLTLLGERDIADSYAGAKYFTDAPDWAANAIAYAYAMNYVQGVGGTLFDPNQPADAGQFATMLLRVLGYSDAQGGDFTWDKGLDFGVTVGLLTTGESTGLKTQFLRDHLIYMSYYSLDARLKNSAVTLEQTLINRGVLSYDVVISSRNKVTRQRDLQ